MGFTPEQELAVSKFQKAFVDYQTKEALVNIFVFLMTAATLLLPIILAFTTRNFANLLLLLIYPISTIFMGQIRYSRMNFFFNFNWEYWRNLFYKVIGWTRMVLVCFSGFKFIELYAFNKAPNTQKKSKYPSRRS